MQQTIDPSKTNELGQPAVASEPTSRDVFSREVVGRHLDKILVSPSFLRSRRLGRFLRFTVQQYLDGQQSALKEYLVGVEVFNKHESFDPRIDSIVRVEARRLRSKLERYYQTDGVDDVLVIQFRKGSYVPHLLTQEQARALIDFNGMRTGLKSVAVAHFSNLGSEPAHSYFCSGLTDDIVTALTKIPTLRVVAKLNSSDGAVKADYAIEGSVRKQAEKLRISTQLIATASSTYIWSETYEREMSDGFAVQDEIAGSIVSALRREFKVP